MRLKILPALLGLHSGGELPSDMRIVGISRKAWDDAQLHTYIEEVLPSADESFLSRFIFLQGDAEDVATFSKLSEVCGDADLLMYLALSPVLYKTVFENMGRAHLPAGRKVMIEKPFGISGASAEELYAQLQTVVDEQNIFFVDHYLAKDWVRGLKSLPVPRENILHIHVTFFEKIGVEKRGASYDHVGALRDVGQNHVLQIVAHILGTQALEQLPLLSPEEVTTKTVRVQYKGYRDIKGVAADSQTETYFKVDTDLLTLEGGKAMPNSIKEVVLTLKDGSEIKISEFPNKIPEYEMLISVAMKGDQTLFPSIRDIRAQWRFIDPILQAWATLTL